MDEMTGLGPIEPLLKDDSIADILINGCNQVYIERGGKLQLAPVRFADNDHLLRIVQRIVAAVGRRVDESQPLVDARLLDGSRVNAAVPDIGQYYYEIGPQRAYRNLDKLFALHKDRIKLAPEKLSHYFISMLLHYRMLLRQCGILKPLGKKEISDIAKEVTKDFTDAFLH
jgi:hypothetical protein